MNINPLNQTDIFLDVALWPVVITDQMITHILDLKIKNIGDISKALVVETDRGRKYSRHLSEANFYLQKANGIKEKRQWLIFSETTIKVYCYTCKLFSKKSTQLSRNGCCDWKNITKKISEHEQSMDHKRAMCSFCERLNTKGRIDNEIVIQIENEKRYWRKVLKRVVATVQFLSSCTLPFRGGNTESKGNYDSALHFLAKFDPFLANHIKNYAHRVKGSVSYLSNTICDEFINIMRDKLRSQFIEEVKCAKYYSLIVDSTPDVSHVDQLTFVLRYVLFYFNISNTIDFLFLSIFDF